ncbi:glutamyl-tRNA reductase [Natronomonas marina]|uniref:glutamyl-tRNA reductase n=1 Tax=Natronomonas marina TaxID=2961939 RepID=UPI0020C9B1BD|nr:glutamyl-tRNA reductase [Natronomonas marina]
MTTGSEIIAGVSVSHSHAGVADIEAACAASQRAAVSKLLEEPRVSEAFVLQTCNRAEAYVVADDEATAKRTLDSHFEAVGDDALRELGHEASLQHLMRVACGLESLVLGEDQIIGQVREAYEEARAAGGIGPTLDDAVLKALHVGERARDETEINEGVLSLGSAAVRLAEAERDLEGATVLVVGAGEIATLAARSVADPADRVVVANRTIPHAEHVVNELDCEGAAVGIDAVPVAAAEADILITATGSDEHIVDREALSTAGETFVVDLAQPRDVAPDAESLDDVAVRDLDALESVTDETRRQRRRAAETVEAMIDEEFDRLLEQYKRKRADEVIAAMYEGAERIKGRELRTAISKLESEGDGVTDHEREVLESMADALVGQLLSAPTRGLRDAAENDDWSTINTALQLFGPDLEPTPTDISTLPDGPDSLPEEMRQQMPPAVLEQLQTEED